MALLVLIPINISGGMLSDMDKISISNIQPHSLKFLVHISMMYLFTFWTCYLLYKEYGTVASIRSNFLASKSMQAEQFTVLVRNVPHVPGCSFSNTVKSFFQKKYPNEYLCHQVAYNTEKYEKMVRERQTLENDLHYNRQKLERHPEKRPTKQTGFLGLWGEQVDCIEYYQQQLNKLDEKLRTEYQRILMDPMSVAFVSFNSQLAANVCGETVHSYMIPPVWMCELAPERRDIYWKNLGIPFNSLCIREGLVPSIIVGMVFIFMMINAWLQNTQILVPFLRPLIELSFMKYFLQGFLPVLALKTCLWFLPNTLMRISKFEGQVAVSVLERSTASKQYVFTVLNVLLASIVNVTTTKQLHSLISQPDTEIPRILEVSFPMQAGFFILYIMVDGWVGMAAEILRLKPLVMFHIKNLFVVKTEKDRLKAMNSKGIDFPQVISSPHLYFLIGVVYAVVTPILLPFIFASFALGYFVYRHQIINVYNQRYESAAAFWPHVHTRILVSLFISQVLLFGFLCTKQAAYFSPLLVLLMFFTLWFHKYSKLRFEPIFLNIDYMSLKDKDALEKVSRLSPDMKLNLRDAYLHPALCSYEDFELSEYGININQVRSKVN